MSYDETLRKLGTNTQRALNGVRLQLVAGEIDRATARELWKIILETAGAQGQTLGALAFETNKRVATGEGAIMSKHVKGALGPPTVATEERMAKALDTIMDGAAADMARRLDRLGFSDPVARSQEEFGLRMSRDPQVEKWTRGMEADACELCRWFYKGGMSWPKDHPMPTHTGCTCHQVPQFITKRQYTERVKAEEKEKDDALYALLDRVGLDKQGRTKK